MLNGQKISNKHSNATAKLLEKQEQALKQAKGEK
jgi:hypothetical protein